MNSIGTLRDCADFHLRTYTDPDSGFAFATYDQWYGSPDILTPLDCLAANLLNMDLRHKDVIPLFGSTGTAACQLREAMQKVLDNSTVDDHFLRLSSIDSSPFDLVRAANKVTESVSEWTAVAVCKVLHRLRPRLVPVYDSVVRRYYGVPQSQRAPRVFFERLHEDLRANEGWLNEKADVRTTPDGRTLSVLRVADIIIWHHVREGGCDSHQRDLASNGCDASVLEQS